MLDFVRVSFHITGFSCHYVKWTILAFQQAERLFGCRWKVAAQGGCQCKIYLGIKNNLRKLATYLICIAAQKCLFIQNCCFLC